MQSIGSSFEAKKNDSTERVGTTVHRPTSVIRVFTIANKETERGEGEVKAKACDHDDGLGFKTPERKTVFFAIENSPAEVGRH